MTPITTKLISPYDAMATPIVTTTCKGARLLLIRHRTAIIIKKQHVLRPLPGLLHSSRYAHHAQLQWLITAPYEAIAILNIITTCRSAMPASMTHSQMCPASLCSDPAQDDRGASCHVMQCQGQLLKAWTDSALDHACKISSHHVEERPGTEGLNSKDAASGEHSHRHQRLEHLNERH